MKSSAPSSARRRSWLNVGVVGVVRNSVTRTPSNVLAEPLTHGRVDTNQRWPLRQTASVARPSMAPSAIVPPGCRGEIGSVKALSVVLEVMSSIVVGATMWPWIWPYRMLRVAMSSQIRWT